MAITKRHASGIPVCAVDAVEGLVCGPERMTGKAPVCDDYHSGSLAAPLKFEPTARGRKPMAPELFLLAVGFILYIAGTLAATPDEAL